ncbi:LysR family transcriptional regulator [Rhizobium leguminosarum]|nr:LysR family transcriptional regulator [Rhizobium leguminosarum]UIJ82186.1 LysR family transcriptional regulator [Rhizobium leguminosarum]WFT89515.1 LysR family transcriptional regulator [Rhizobium leguminosarum]
MTPMHPSQSRAEFSLTHIDLNLLRVFDVLMQERSVTKAASRLGRTQSAISHSLAKLREIFKDELFSRDAGVMEPTPRARELAVGLSRALADIRSVVDRHLNFKPEETQRNFRVGLSDYTAVAILPRLIEAFSSSAPNATLNVLHVRETDVSGLLRNGEIECAILGNSTLQNGLLAVEELSRDEMVCAGWRGNPMLDDMTVENYLALPHLQISADGTAVGIADVTLKAMGLSRRVVATVPHYLVAPWVIKGTQLITAFGDSVLLALSDESEMRIVSPPIPLPNVILSLIFERGVSEDPGQRWFRDLVKSVSDSQRKRKATVYQRLKLPMNRP